MKTIYILIISFVTCTAIGQSKKSYPLDIDKSVINWEGSYSFLFVSYQGTVHFKQGVLYTSDGHISGGSFVIDMTSITNEDYEKQRGPVAHLRDTDFFDVNKHPEATLEMTSVSYYKEENTHRILADLTIKGITKSIDFYATVDEGEKTMNAKIKIDRTRWGITYNNEVKNKAISEAVLFEVFLHFDLASF